jgi:uncharacterized repeat protein (TIGR03803 family)
MNREDRQRLLAATAALALAVALTPTTLTAKRSHSGGKSVTETVLYSFQGGTDGAYPYGLLMDAAGNLYGTTNQGGATDNGTVFQLDTGGHETVLYSFRGGADGQGPVAGVIMDSAGNLYGTTQSGGPYSGGIAFKLDSSGKETVLHRFGGVNDGATPLAALVRDRSGNLYGTASAGGTYGGGTVFKIDKNGKETALWNMDWPDPAFPFDGLVMDAKGELYGTTTQGGGGTNGGYGVVFELNPHTGVPTVLYKFKGYPDGDYSEAGLLRDSAGNLYGTTESGGSNCSPYGCGTVFKVTKTGKETVLHSFDASGKDGNQPIAGVVRDKAGNLYGTTPWGDSLGCGGNGCGTVFKLDTAGKETVLYRFQGGTDGAYPQGGLILGNDGSLYGATQQGGTGTGCGGAGCGTIWKMTP